MSAPVSQVLEECEAMRQAGNTAFKSEDLEGALDKYTKAFVLVAQAFSLDADEKHKLNQAKLLVHLNRAVVLRRLSRFAECVNECDAALAIEPSNVKGLARRGAAHMELGNLQPAHQDFLRVKDLDPKFAGIDTLLAKLEKKQKKRDKKEKKMYAAMMSGWATPRGAAEPQAQPQAQPQPSPPPPPQQQPPQAYGQDDEEDSDDSGDGDLSRLNPWPEEEDMEA